MPGDCLAAGRSRCAEEPGDEAGSAGQSAADVSIGKRAHAIRARG